MVSETHLTKGQPFEIKDFTEKHNSFSTVDAEKARGGISCCVKPSYLKHIFRINTDIPENIILYFKNGDTVFGSYIAPCDSPYYSIGDFCNVANMFVPINYDRVVLGGGDMNGRIGDVKYTLPTNMEYLPNVDNVINDHGKEILKICRSFRCFIVNNLKIQNKIFKSDFTFFKGKTGSQNDICLVNNLEMIRAFSILEKSTYSDHNPI